MRQAYPSRIVADSLPKVRIYSGDLVRRLVIHIGLAKTATTSLQTHTYPELPGYLGKFSTGQTYESTALYELLHLYDSGAFIDNERLIEIDGSPARVPVFRPWIEELVASDEDILLWSEEGLTH